jgi:hypothetical protein
LNEIINTKPDNIDIESKVFTKENSKMFIELDASIIQELLLRYYQEYKSNDNETIYFYSYETKVVMDRLN